MLRSVLERDRIDRTVLKELSVDSGFILRLTRSAQVFMLQEASPGSANCRMRSGSLRLFDPNRTCRRPADFPVPG